MLSMKTVLRASSETTHARPHFHNNQLSCLSANLKFHNLLVQHVVDGLWVDVQCSQSLTAAYTSFRTHAETVVQCCKKWKMQTGKNVGPHTP